MMNTSFEHAMTTGAKLRWGVFGRILCSGFLLLSLFNADVRMLRASVSGFKVTTDQTIDASSLKTIVRQVVARANAKNNDEKAIAIYEYLHNTIFHWAYPEEVAPQTVGPLKVLNVYGWSLCGGEHAILKALYEAQGWEGRYVLWPGHETIEVKYDGRWHYFDVFLKCYYWSKDRTHVVSQEEIANDPSIVMDAVKEGRAARQNLICGDLAEDVVKGCQHRQVSESNAPHNPIPLGGNIKGWFPIYENDGNYSPALNLPVGATLRLDWKSEPNGYAINGLAPQHSCMMKDIVNDSVLGPIAEHYGPRNWSDGRFNYAPDFAQPAAVADIVLEGARAEGGMLKAIGNSGRAIFPLSLPFSYVSARLDVSFAGGDGRISVSTDAGRTWHVVSPGDISGLVKQKYDVWLKVEFPDSISKINLDALVEHNRGALPYLVNGENRISVSLDQAQVPRGNKLIVTYAYQEATRPKSTSRIKWDGRNVHYGPVKIVTREITSIPFTFDIKVGGNTAPKMLWLARRVEPALVQPRTIQTIN